MMHPKRGLLEEHSTEGEVSAFWGGKRVTGRRTPKKKTGWAADNVGEAGKGNNGGSRKRVMVVVDGSQESKLALKWTLSHVVQQLDVLTLIHVQPAVVPRKICISYGGRDGSFFCAKAAAEAQRKTNEVAAWEITNSFKTLVETCRPEVEVEILMLEGEKGPAILAQTAKLGVSILVLGSRKPSLLRRIITRFKTFKNESLADFCINNTDCLTLAVRKKSSQSGGYLISSRSLNKFWLLA